MLRKIFYSILVLNIFVSFLSAQDVEDQPGAGLVSPADSKSKVIRQAQKKLTDLNLPGLDKPITYESVPGMDMMTTIQSLTHYGKMKNVVYGKGVTGQSAKVSFDNIPVGEALEIVFSVNNLAYTVNGDILSIMSDEEYKRLYGRSFYDKKQVEVIKLKYADPTRVSTMLASVTSGIGKVTADPVTGSLILEDTPEKIKEMLAVIGEADIETIARVIPTVTESFVLQYAEIEEILSEVTSVLTKEAGAVQANPRTKTLIVTDLPHNMKKIQNLIALFDARPKQVFIESKIVEVKLEDDFNMGVNWDHVLQGLDPRFSLQSVSTPGAPATPVGTFTYNTIVAGGDLNAVLTALKELGDTKVISTPQVAVRDSEEASIKVIERQPYKIVGLETGTTNVTEVSYQFVDVGVQLNVTPRINDEEFISVSVKPDISSISTWYDGDPQEGTPVIKTSTAETTVMVKDGVTIIIGGMIKDEEYETVSALPFLGKIPLIGLLFRNKSTSVVSTETIVFLTPRIVTGEESFLRMKDMKKKPKPLRTVGRQKKLKPIR